MRRLVTPLFTKPSSAKPVEVKPFLYRVLIALLAGLWWSFLPVYLIVLYMAERRFFSYELLSEDVVGMKTLVVSAGVFLFFISLFLFGFLLIAKYAIAVAKQTGEYDSTRWLTWLAFAEAVFLHILLFYIALSEGKPNLLFGMSAFAVLVCWYMASFIGGSLSQKLSNWLPTAMFIVLTAFLPFAHRDVTADLLEIALRQFRVGGGISVKVMKGEDQKLIAEGRLLLMTPRNLYIAVPGDDKRMAIIRNGDDLRVEVKNG